MAYITGTTNVLGLMEIVVNGGEGEAKDENGKTWQSVFKNPGIGTLQRMLAYKPDAPFAYDLNGNSTELIIPYKASGVRIAKKGYRPSGLNLLFGLTGEIYTGSQYGQIDTVDVEVFMHGMLYVELQGGGGGGGSQTDGQNGGGGGGGAGGFVCGYLPIRYGDILEFHVGNGGAAKSSYDNEPGYNGQDSYIINYHFRDRSYTAHCGGGGQSGSDRKGGAGGGTTVEPFLANYTLARINGAAGGNGYASPGSGDAGKNITGFEVDTHTEFGKKYFSSPQDGNADGQRRRRPNRNTTRNRNTRKRRLYGEDRQYRQRFRDHSQHGRRPWNQP